jgi:hypothetical protein
MDQFVVCVQRQTPGDNHSAVVALGVAASPRATAREMLTVEGVVQRKKSGIDHFFTERRDGTPVEVYPRFRDGQFYLATSPDGEESGNLESLIDCGAESPLATYISRSLTLPEPSVDEAAVRAVDLGLDHFVVAAVGFRDERGFVMVSLATLTGMAIEQVWEFLKGMRTYDALGQDAATMAESFRNYQIGRLKRDPDTIMTVHAWPDAYFRITVDLTKRDAAHMPDVTAIGAILVDVHGNRWDGEGAPDDVRVRWKRVR